MNHFRALITFLWILGMTLSSAWASVYYVSPDGDDSQAGSQMDPFKTIQQAADVMIAGDSCIIATGIYRETVRPAADNVAFLAATGAEVELSGFDLVNGWAPHNGNIYVADMDWTLGTRNQLMYEDQMMILARWPNKSSFDPFELATAKGFGTRSTVTNANIPAINWGDGGVIFFLGKNRWTSWRTSIAGTSAGEVSFTQISDDWQWGGSHSPENGGDFYLMNHIDALDSEGEWFLDRQADKLYFYPPGGSMPAQDAVEAKRRTTGFNLANRTGIVLDGLSIVGANINMSNAESCSIQNCKIYYGNHSIGTGAAAFVNEGSIVLNDNSQDNLIVQNDIQWGAVNGIILKGTGNEVTNNYIGNFNYLSSYGAPVELRGTNDLTYNEIFRGGRDLVRGGGNGSICAYNDMHHSNVTNDDCGPIYTCCGNYGNTTIHHNWIHDCESRDGHFTKYKATGIYLDNSTEDIIAHHNVLWNLEWAGIQINWAGKNLLIYNNTVWSNAGPESRTMGRWVNDFEFTNVQVYNTLANEGEFHATDQGNNVVLNLNANPFEDFANRNFVPKAGSSAVDAGTSLPGYTDNAIGDPDAGAYERGDTPWIPGPDWELSSPPTSIQTPQTPLPSLGLFPNPSRGHQVSVVAEIRGSKSLSVLDQRGRLVMQTSFSGFRHELDVSRLSGGFYFIRVQTAEGLLSGKLVVK